MSGDESPRKIYTEKSIPPLFCYLYRRAQHECLLKGYALAIHGTLARDCDMVAVAWTDEACSADELVEVLAELFVEHDYEIQGPTEKPHGRVAWSFTPFGLGPGYIDLSIIGPR